MIAPNSLVVIGLLASLLTAQEDLGVPRVESVTRAEEGVPYFARGVVTGLPPDQNYWVRPVVEQLRDGKWTRASAHPLGQYGAHASMRLAFNVDPSGTHTFGFLLASGPLIWGPGPKRVRFSLSRVGRENWIHGPWHEFILQPSPATNRLVNDAITEANMFPITGVPSRRGQMLLDFYSTTWNVDGGCPMFWVGGPNAPELFLDDVQALATDPRMSPTWRAYAALRGLSVARGFAEGYPDRRADMQRRAAVFLPLAELSGPRWQWMIDWEKLRLQALRGAVDRRDLERFRDHPERDPSTSRWVQSEMSRFQAAGGR